MVQIQLMFNDKFCVKNRKTLCLTGDLSFTFIKKCDILRVKNTSINSVYWVIQHAIFNPITSFGPFTECEANKKVQDFEGNFSRRTPGVTATST